MATTEFPGLSWTNLSDFANSRADAHTHAILNDQGIWTGSPCTQNINLTRAYDLPIDRTYNQNNKMNRRLTRLTIIDEQINVPDKQSMIYDSGEILTSKSDDAFIFETAEAIKEALANHNAKRVLIQNKALAAPPGKPIFLSPLDYDDLRFCFNRL